MAAKPPPQAEPVRRPQVLPPHETVDVEHGTAEQLVDMRMELMHGANYNDPAPWSPMSFDARRRAR
jgi:cyanobactin biosynthesis protein (PatB/AcyB/McaB family)